MKFLLGPNEDIIKKNLQDNHMYAEWVNMDTVFPSDFAQKVKDFVEKHKDADNGIYLTYNIQLLNNLPPEMVLWVDTLKNEDGTEEIVTTPFTEVFEYWIGLDIGDIFFMFVNNPTKKSHGAEEYEHKVRYHSPGFWT